MRRILHVDCDAFYASVEQRDQPELRGKPVAVGFPGPRGVVMTASYEARKYGVGSAMPSVTAAQRCPELIFLPARMDAYRQESRKIRAIFARYTDLSEPLSLDEAYLDVTQPKQGPPSGTLIAKRIKQEVLEMTGLTVTAGVSYCKFLAKLASGMNKPDGLTVIEPDGARAFIATLPIEAFFGVGPKTAARMHAQGIRCGADLEAQTLEDLEAWFGKHGRHFYQIARGIDDRPVNPNRERKSIGVETTFLNDLQDVSELAKALEPLTDKLSERLERSELAGRVVVLKIKYRDFCIITRRTTLYKPVQQPALILTTAIRLLQTDVDLSTPVRLIGVSVQDLQAAGELPLQPRLQFVEFAE